VKTAHKDRYPVEIIPIVEWSTYYKKLLTEGIISYTVDETITRATKTEGKLITVTTGEVETAVKNLRAGKAAGPGNIPAELLKNAPLKLLKMIAQLFTICINKHTIPKEWRIVHITPIFKHCDRKNCDNYRAVSITSTFSRLFGRITRDLIENEYPDKEAEEQACVRVGRSCNDNTFVIKQLIEKQLNVGKEVNLLFIDFKKAYDKIPLIKLWKALEETGISYTLIKTVEELYRKVYLTLNLEASCQKVFEETKGLRQGCCTSPILFKIYIEKALNIWKRKCFGMGYNADNTMMYTLQFADDQVVMAQSEEDLEYMCRKLQEEYSKWGLTMNIVKTKYMSLGTDTNYIEVDNGDIITGCTEYKYLGSIFTKDGRHIKNIRHRVTQARKIIGALNEIWL
jgi:hypothetical protein